MSRRSAFKTFGADLDAGECVCRPPALNLRCDGAAALWSVGERARGGIDYAACT